MRDGFLIYPERSRRVAKICRRSIKNKAGVFMDNVLKQWQGTLQHSTPDLSHYKMADMRPGSELRKFLEECGFKNLAEVVACTGNEISQKWQARKGIHGQPTATCTASRSAGIELSVGFGCLTYMLNLLGLNLRDG